MRCPSATIHTALPTTGHLPLRPARRRASPGCRRPPLILSLWYSQWPPQVRPLTASRKGEIHGSDSTDHALPRHGIVRLLPRERSAGLPLALWHAAAHFLRLALPASEHSRH